MNPDPTIIYRYSPSEGTLQEYNVEKTTPKCYFIKRIGGSFHDTYRLLKTEVNPSRPLTWRSSYWTEREPLKAFALQVEMLETARHEKFISNSLISRRVMGGMA